MLKSLLVDKDLTCFFLTVNQSKDLQQSNIQNILHFPCVCHCKIHQFWWSILIRYPLTQQGIYRLVSDIRCTSNTRRTLTLGNSQLEFSPTISLTKTSNTRRTPSFGSWVSIVDKVWSRPTWSELLRVTWDFDSPWITGPVTARQSVAYVRRITLAPAANLCTLSAIIFLPIKAWIWRHLRWYIEGSAILLTVNCQLSISNYIFQA